MNATYGVAKLSLGTLFVVTYSDEAVLKMLSKIQDFHYGSGDASGGSMVPRVLVFVLVFA